MAANRLNLPRVRASTAAIVLVGGQSTRMGTDKASLVVDGVAMGDRVVLAARQAGISTIVLAGTTEVPDATGATPNANPQGPLAGVVGAWESLQTGPSYDPVVVLSCDLPWLVAEVIEQLVESSAAHTHGAVAHDGQRPQPLVAAYRPRALVEMAARFYDGERSLRRCAANWDLGEVSVTSQLVADADTPEDLRGFTVQWPS